MKKISRILFALLLACTVSNSMAAETKKGDINGDDQVNITDVTILVDVILGKGTPNAACDITGDNQVNVTDVITLGNIILGKTPPGSDSSEIVDDPPAWEPANAPKRKSDDSLNIHLKPSNILLEPEVR